MRFALTAVLVAAIGAVPGTSAAQRIHDSRVAFAATPSIALVARQDSAQSREGVVATRILFSVIGMGAGFGIGAYAGSQADEDCGDCFIAVGTAIGAAIGGWLGAAMGAALPSFQSRCHGAERFARALGGSLLGGAVGGLAASLAPEAGLVIVLVAIPVGATIAQGRC